MCGGDPFNDAIHYARELQQRWDNRVAIGQVPIGELYLKGNVELLAEFKIGDRGRFQEPLAVAHLGPRVEARDHGVVKPPQLKTDADGDSNGKDEFVLIVNIEFVDHPERRVTRLVRLERADYLDDLWAGLVYTSIIDRRLKVLPFDDRELGLLRDRALLQADGIANHMVEGRPEVVNRVAQQQGHAVGHPLSHSHPEARVGGRIAITFDNEAIRASLSECRDFPLQLTDVLLGPLNL